MIIAIKIMQVVIAVLAFVAAAVMVWTLRPRKILIRTYERVNNQLKEVKGGISYEKTERFLKSHGAAYHYGSWITPLKYMILKVVAGIVCFGIGTRINIFVAVALMMLGYQLPSILLLSLNKSDNVKMIPQMQGLYNALQEQVKAGVYVTDALTECYRGIEKGRLRIALEELSGDIMLKILFEAMGRFQSKFDNSSIDALTVILVQAQESGQSADLLSDMSEQIKDMQAVALLKKKERLNRMGTFCIMGILSVIIAVILYAFATSMFNTVSTL